VSRTPAKLTQPDIARCIRAAKQTGADSVEVVLPNVTIRINLLSSNGKPDTQPAAEEEVVL
jgi:hypothetical protein